MEKEIHDSGASPSPAPPLLHTLRPLRRRHFNRLFACLYSILVLSLLHRHLHAAVRGPSLVTPLLLLIADAVLAFGWLTGQAFRMNPVVRKEFPENLRRLVPREDYPAVDIFICTADPYKEPPMVAVNTALSVMAYDYPPDKLSVYVSDDGGSELTLFAFMVAAKFAKTWLHFCRENNIVDTNPDVYFNSNNATNLDIKNMYETMKLKVETAVNCRKVPDDYISGEDDCQILRQFAVDGFSSQDHPAVIQILLNSKKDKDGGGGPTPNLIYVSREKRRHVPHNFKAGALNALLRVSACMTNSPILLTLDCDMFSNDPITVQRVLCYWAFKPGRPNSGYIQFPQRFHGINQGDIYDGEIKIPLQVNPTGLDGLKGPTYDGTGCFFKRRVFFGGPSSYIAPENHKLDPDFIVDRDTDDSTVIKLARVVASCDYESDTDWGSKIGFFYGSLVEDYYTGFRLQCEEWQSIFCDPERPAFMGEAPISLNGGLGQIRRWCIGLLEVCFSKYSPVTYGVKSIGLWMGLGYAHYAFWPMRSIPVIIYGFFSPIAVLRGIPFFPEVNKAWFSVYLFLFVGAYAQECFEFVSKQGTLRRWWSSQRIWLIQALSSHLLGTIEYAAKRLGLGSRGFDVTAKASDGEQRRRYDRGEFEFGVASPMFVAPLAAAVLNLAALVSGCVRICGGGGGDWGLVLQAAVAGFAVANGVPFYWGLGFGRGGGGIQGTTAVNAVVLVGVVFAVSCVLM